MRWATFFHRWKRSFDWLAETDCVKIALPQDEYDHSEVLDEWLYELGMSDVFTIFGGACETLYPLMSRRARFHHCLTGYIDEAEAARAAVTLRALPQRPHDIVYRASHLPFWFGSRGQLKHRIGDAVAAAAARHGLDCDISTRAEDTIHGRSWLEFLASGRAVIGCESGSSVLDRRGEVQAAISHLLEKQPDLTFEEVGHRLPEGWDSHTYFALSPRHLEAVITKTAQVLVAGRYDGVLEADRHYIPLEPDLSNLDGVLERLRDLPGLERMTARAYEDVHLSGRFSYRQLASELQQTIEQAPARRLPRPGRRRLKSAEALGEEELARAGRTVTGPPLPTRPQRMPKRRLSILILANYHYDHADTVVDHHRAFGRYSRHRIRYWDPVGHPDGGGIDLEEFDAVVIHYSVNLVHMLRPAQREWLRAYSGLKVQFIQDEYRWVDDTTRLMRYVGIGLLFTVAPDRELSRLYGDNLPGVRIYPTLTGYVPERLQRVGVPPLRERSVEIGYRGRELPFWLGSLTQEKATIAKGVVERAERYGLRCDVSWLEKDRIYGPAWPRFIASCRSTLATESGATIADFDGSVEAKVKGYLADHPGADFAEVSEAVLLPHEGNVHVNVVSPRIFEAAALRTALILFPGEYSGVVAPDVHYIPLAKDFSNLDEVVEKLRDDRLVETMTERAHRDLIDSGRYSYRAFVHEFDHVVSAVHTGGKHRSLVQPRYRRATLRRHPSQLPAAVRLASVLLAWRAGERARAGQMHRPRAAGMAAALGDRRLRALLLAYLMSPRAWRTVRLEPLLDDLLRLAIMLRARNGTLKAGGQFRLDAAIDAIDATDEAGETRGRVVLRSRPVDAAGTEPPEPGAVRRLLDRVRLADLVWDHSRIGTTFVYPLTLVRWIRLEVGAGGVARLDAVARLAAVLPDQVGRLLDQLTTVSVPRTRPNLKAARAALRLSLGTPSLRAILLAYLFSRGARRAARIQVLLRDLLRLAILQQAARSRLRAGAPFAVAAGWNRRQGRLRLVSRDRPAPLGAAAVQDLREVFVSTGLKSPITWDHTRRGGLAYHAMSKTEWLPVAVGDDGVHAFKALHAVRPFMAETVWRALDPLVSPARVTSQAPGTISRLRTDPRDLLVKSRVALRLGWRDQALRPLVISYLTHPSAWRACNPGLFLEDLFKLAIVLQSERFQLTAGIVFRVSVHLDETAGRLTVTSILREDAQDRPELLERPDPTLIRDALQQGRIREILWDHTQIGEVVYYGLTAYKWLKLTLGERGVHQFTALDSVARLAPNEVFGAFAPILAKRPLQPVPRQPRLARLHKVPDRARRAAHGALAPAGRFGAEVGRFRPAASTATRAALRSVPDEPVLDPVEPLPQLRERPALGARTRVGQALAAVRLCLGDGTARSVLRRYFGSSRIRRAVPLDDLLGDLARLQALRMAVRGRFSHFRVRAVAGGDGSVRMVSEPAGGASESPPARAQALDAVPVGIVWDHSRVGDHVLFPLAAGKRVTLNFGPDGVHDFDALTVVAESISAGDRERLIRLPSTACLRRSVLLLCDDSSGHAGTVLEHIEALRSMSRHRIHVYNPRGLERSRWLDLSEFDAVVIHYSITLVNDHYLSGRFRQAIRDFDGLKVQFIQDEYRNVDEVTGAIRDLGVHALFSVVPRPQRDRLYHKRLPGVELHTVLTGYVPSRLGRVRVPPPAKRPIDIGYRGRDLPMWLGRLAYEKRAIAEGVAALGPDYGLRCDISFREEDRLYGDRWLQFLASCRATLGTESGASISDPDGSVEAAVRSYQRRRPAASFDEVHRRVLARHENKLRIGVVSPRIFEAAATRTALILFPGDYSGVVQPEIHYFQLERDFRNFDEIAARVRDERELTAITERAYRDLIASGAYGYAHLAEEMDQVIDRGAPARAGSVSPLYRLSRVEARLAPIRQPSWRRPRSGLSQTLGRLAGRTAVGRLMRDPGDYARKGLLAARLTLRDAPLRNLLRAYLSSREARHTMTTDEVLEDLLKLALIHNIAAPNGNRLPYGVTSSWDPQSGYLVVRSTTPATATQPARLPDDAWPVPVLWDHSEVGSHVLVPPDATAPVRVALGEDGRHTFTALDELARRWPDLYWQAVAPLAVRGSGTSATTPGPAGSSRSRKRG